MHSTTDILTTVRELVSSTLSGGSIRDDEDMFDAGATSLTIVDLQIRLEERLHLRTPTSRLLAAPTIQDWATIYLNAQREPGSK